MPQLRKNISILTTPRTALLSDMAKNMPTSRSKPSDASQAIFRGGDHYGFIRAAYPPGGSYGTNRQQLYQLVVMLQGDARIWVREETLLLGTGEALLVHPGWPILYRFADRRASLHTSCQMAPSALSPVERRILSQTLGVHRVPAFVHALINEGLAAPLVTGPTFHTAQEFLARACLLRFAAHVAESLAADLPPHPALNRATQLLENTPADIHSALQLAERCGISVSRLRQLHQAAGMESPSVRLWRIKTEHAVRMIRATGLTLGEIAEQSGFANPFHLSRNVKKLTGYPPRELRRKEWGEA